MTGGEGLGLVFMDAVRAAVGVTLVRLALLARLAGTPWVLREFEELTLAELGLLEYKASSVHEAGDNDEECVDCGFERGTEDADKRFALYDADWSWREYCVCD